MAKEMTLLQFQTAITAMKTSGEWTHELKAIEGKVKAAKHKTLIKELKAVKAQGSKRKRGKGTAMDRYTKALSDDDRDALLKKAREEEEDQQG